MCQNVHMEKKNLVVGVVDTCRCDQMKVEWRNLTNFEGAEITDMISAKQGERGKQKGDSALVKDRG